MKSIHLKKLFIFFYWVFAAVLAFCSYSRQGLLLVVVHHLPIAVASLFAEKRSSRPWALAL